MDITGWETKKDEINLSDLAEKLNLSTPPEDKHLQLEEDKKSIIKKTKSAYIVNTAHCRSEAELIKFIIQSHGWKETIMNYDGNFVCFGLRIKPEDIDEMKKNKAIFNRFPEADTFAHKKELGDVLNRLFKYFPEDFTFYPRTYTIPGDDKRLANDLEESKGKKTYIFKPSAGSQGEGIHLFKTVADYESLLKSQNGHEFVVQEYIADPLLVDGKKFDCRIYVLITGLRPMKAFVCKEGLARFCTENYEPPTKANMHKCYMHLTNYSLNKNSKDYKTSEEIISENDASKRTLTSLYLSLSKMGIAREEIEEKIREVCEKIVLAIEPYLTHEYNLSMGKDPIDPERVFHVFGFDILFDKNKNPWILEINANPSLNINLEIDKPDGEFIKLPSEIDKFVKNIVMDGAIRIMKKRKHVFFCLNTIKKILELNDYANYVRILPGSEADSKYQIFSKAVEIFERLSGIRGSAYLTQGKFVKIGRYPGMLGPNLTKPDYDILFTNLVIKGGGKMMYLNSFFDGLTIIANRLNPHGNEYKNLNFIVNSLYSATEL